MACRELRGRPCRRHGDPHRCDRAFHQHRLRAAHHPNRRRRGHRSRDTTRCALQVGALSLIGPRYQWRDRARHGIGIWHVRQRRDPQRSRLRYEGHSPRRHRALPGLTATHAGPSGADRADGQPRAPSRRRTWHSSKRQAGSSGRRKDRNRRGMARCVVRRLRASTRDRSVGRVPPGPAKHDTSDDAHSRHGRILAGTNLEVLRLGGSGEELAGRVPKSGDCADYDNHARHRPPRHRPPRHRPRAP